MNNRVSYFLQPLISAVFVLIALLIFQKVTTGSFTNAPKRTFEVQGQGTVTIVSQIIQTDFTIQETGTSQADAQQKGNAKENQATDLLKKLGFKSSDIKTVSYNISPNYDNSPNIMIYPPRPQGNSQNGYVINIDTQIQTTNIDKMNQAIDQLTALGTNVNGISYDTSPTDTNNFMNEARTKAIADARQKAESMAKAAGFTLGSIQTIKDLDDNPPVVYPMMKAEGAAGTVAPSTPTNIQPGSDQITSNVSITYYIQ